MGGSLRTNTLYGKDQLIVPVVALVEGVLQAMNAATPELALAKEFGKFPAGWDGRPVVMNHPIIDKNPVSANSPTVLETFAFGTLFNTSISDDGKLVTEAWIDLERVAALGGEVQETIDRIQAGEIVEVSTGLFTETEEVSGFHGGKQYLAVWRNIVPDHLAFLSAGTLGACSVEAGCGTRVNAAPAPTWMEYAMPKDLQDKDEDDTEPKAAAEPKVACGCGGDSAPAVLSNEEHSFDIARFLASSIPDSMLDSDARSLVQAALRNKVAGYSYVVGMMGDSIIYERYNDFVDQYNTYKLGFSIGEDNKVTFNGEPVEVILTTKVTPKANSSMESDMTNPKDPAAPVEPKVSAATPDNTITTPVAAPVVEQPKTLSDHLAAMPAEMREMLQSGLRLHAEQKSAAIKALKDTGRCTFDDTYLAAQSLDTLKALGALASVPTYDGQAAPRVNSTHVEAETHAPAMPTL